MTIAAFFFLPACGETHICNIGIGYHFHSAVSILMSILYDVSGDTVTKDTLTTIKDFSLFKAILREFVSF